MKEVPDRETVAVMVSPGKTGWVEVARLVDAWGYSSHQA